MRRFTGFFSDHPVRGVGYMRTSESGSFPQRVVLYDQLGRQVLEKQWVGETTALDLTHLPGGVYFWEVFSGDRERCTGKVLKGY